VQQASRAGDKGICLEEINRQASAKHGAPKAAAADAVGLTGSARQGGLTLGEAIGKFARRVKVERIEEIRAIAQTAGLAGDQGIHQWVGPAATEAERIVAVARPVRTVAGEVLLGQEKRIQEGGARHYITRKDVDLIVIRDAAQTPATIAYIPQFNGQI